MTLANAQFRAALASNVVYDVDLALPKGDHFFGRCTVNFDLSEAPAKKFYLDFRGLKIANLKINGTAIQNESGEDQTVFLNHAISLAPQHLKVGTNVVEMNFWNKYRNDSIGLHSFVDGEDQEQYIYTQFESSFCHYVFPCFD